MSKCQMCASVCLYVFMYYVYMYVVFIVINVCKLLHVRRPTSSPRAVWNPCKINKALKKCQIIGNLMHWLNYINLYGKLYVSIHE